MLTKIIWRLLKIILIPVLIIGLVLGYFGFIPVVSSLFGSDQPKDLGAAWTESDRLAANQKYDQEFVTVESGLDPLSVLRGAKPNQIDESFSGPEIAAHVEETHPVKNVQIVFREDGAFEASGKIDKSRMAGFLRAVGITKIDQAGILATINRYLPGRPAFYLKGTGKVVNNQAQLELTEAKLGRLPLAPKAFAEGLVAYADAVLKNVPHFDAESVTVAGGELKYQGTAPAAVPIY